MSFLRAPDGALTMFDVPGAVNGTVLSAMNPAGVITGGFIDASGVLYRFRTR